ncbi:hypothetical protein JCM19298_767 [Nonlabens ulvanivorans]|nr:hypothetical protein JCM19298_767 [Nonlabens ulvanivorans]
MLWLMLLRFRESVIKISNQTQYILKLKKPLRYFSKLF